MGQFWRISIALLCSILAALIGSVVGFYLVLLFDPNYHDGVSGVGGLIIAVIAAVVTFMVIRKKLNLSL
jgi:uncharacterized membrane protein YeaQ/YmgE (transglycosylase-associated protein family)